MCGVGGLPAGRGRGRQGRTGALGFGKHEISGSEAVQSLVV